VTILGVDFGRTLAQAMKYNWTKVTQAVKAQARQAYSRQLTLPQQIQYVQSYLLAKIWHIALILPLPKTHTRQLEDIGAWFIWQGATFRVPAAILQTAKDKGGLGMLHMEAKCRTLLYNRMKKFEAQGGTDGKLNENGQG
jgi:CHAT domain-containing protein